MRCARQKGQMKSQWANDPISGSAPPLKEEQSKRYVMLWTSWMAKCQLSFGRALIIDMIMVISVSQGDRMTWEAAVVNIQRTLIQSRGLWNLVQGVQKLIDPGNTMSCAEIHSMTQSIVLEWCASFQKSNSFTTLLLRRSPYKRSENPFVSLLGNKIGS